jgi:hypothetical protein
MNEDNLLILFEIAKKHCDRKCFQILTILCEVNYFTISKERVLAFRQEILRNVLDFDVGLIDDGMDSLTGLCPQLQLVLNNCEAFSNFVFELGHRCFPSIQNSMESCQTLLMFWGSCEKVPELRETRIAVIKEFLDNSLTVNEEMSITLFNLTNTESLPTILTTLKDVSAGILSEIANEVIFMEIEKVKGSPPSLAFLCNCVLGMTLGIQVFDPKSPILDILQQLYVLLIVDIYSKLYDTRLIANSFLLFIRRLKELSFMSTVGPVSHAFFSEFSGIESTGKLLEFLFRLIWKLIGGITDFELISAALKSLETLIELESRFAHLVFGRSLIIERVEHPPVFLSAVEYQRCRVALHRCLGRVLLRDDSTSLARHFFTIYGNPLENDERALWGLLCDFTGLLESAIKPEHYRLFFGYLSVNVLPHTFKFVNHLTISKPTLKSLLKMWSEMLRNEPLRIQFKPHSDGGIILFHRTTDLVSTILDVLNESFQLDDRHCLRSLILILRILNRSLTASYIPIAVFETFHDDSLFRLLASFGKAASLFPLSSLTEYSKLDRTLQHLNCSIVTNHMTLAVHPDLALQNLIISILSIGLQSVTPESVRCATETLKKLTSLPALSLIDPELFQNATLRIWNIAMRANEHQQDAFSCLAQILAIDSNMLELAMFHIRKFVIESESHKVEEAYHSFVVLFSESLGNQQLSIDKIRKFILTIRIYLKNPTSVFI